MTDILPCPFCGSADLTLTVDRFGWKVVQCDDCGTSGPCIDLEGEQYIERWNARTPQHVAPAQARRGSMAAQWTYDPEAEAYYFAPMQAAPGPYLKQRHVDAIIDIANDGTLAGVELIDNMPPPPSPVPSTHYRCTCGAEPYCPASHHDISCPLAISSTDHGDAT